MAGSSSTASSLTPDVLEIAMLGADSGIIEDRAHRVGAENLAVVVLHHVAVAACNTPGVPAAKRAACSPEQYSGGTASTPMSGHRYPFKKRGKEANRVGATSTHAIPASGRRPGSIQILGARLSPR